MLGCLSYHVTGHVTGVFMLPYPMEFGVRTRIQHTSGDDKFLQSSIWEQNDTTVYMYARVSIDNKYQNSLSGPVLL